MTKEELYRQIYSHDTIYIPPLDADAAPLEVALGCSWHRCTFCDFAKDVFQVHSMEKIDYNLSILAQLQPENTKIFFLGENAFCIQTERLLEMIEHVKAHMPKIASFSMYSRIDDILRKSDDELKILRENGVTTLHIGMESGSDVILLERKKGVTPAEIVEALHRLDVAGIGYHLTVIPGLGGRALSKLHATETARILNQVHPVSIWCLKLNLYEGTPLYYEAISGKFEEMTPEEVLMEERFMISQLQVENCIYRDTTVLNQYTIQGVLPDEKAKLLHAIDYLLAQHEK